MLDQWGKWIGLVGGIIGILVGIASFSFFIGGEWKFYNQNIEFIEHFKQGGELSISKQGWQDFANSLLDNAGDKFAEFENKRRLVGEIQQIVPSAIARNKSDNQFLLVFGWCNSSQIKKDMEGHVSKNPEGAGRVISETAGLPQNGGGRGSMTFVVPPGWYYQFTAKREDGTVDVSGCVAYSVYI